MNRSRLVTPQDLLRRFPLPYVPDGARLEQLRSRLPLIVWVRHLLDGAARILWFSVGLFVPGVLRPGGLTRSLVPAGVAGWV